MLDRSEKQGTTGGIQSVDVALTLLAEMSRIGGPVSLSDLARRCGMPPSKAHRYLASFTAAGFAVQAGRSGKYNLGPMVLELGLAALARHDFVNRASDALPDLRDETGMTVLLSVWGGEGATVIRWERAPSPIVTSMGLGTTLPLLTSASGRVFLTWAPPAMIAARLEAELEALRIIKGCPSGLIDDIADLDTLRVRIRESGFASVDGRFIPGLVAVSAPVLDWQGEVQCVITLIGTKAASIAPRSPNVARLLAFCDMHSMVTER